MKKIIITLLSVIPITCFANDYRFYYNLHQNVGVSSVDTSNPSENTSDWKNIGEVYGCTNWSPMVSTISAGVEFQQTATDCKQDRERTVANTKETETIDMNQTRNAVGILSEWTPVPLPDWELDYAYYSCTWGPSPATITESTTFNQTADNCKTDYWRHVYPKEMNTATGEIRDAGQDYEEYRVEENVHGIRPYTVALTEWKDTVFYNGCQNWAPAVDTVNKGTQFTQTATDCKREQERSRQESYIDPSVNYKFVLQPTKEKRWSETPYTLTRSAFGTKPFTECRFSVSDKYFVLDADYGTFAWRQFHWNGSIVHWGSQDKANGDPIDTSKFSTTVDVYDFTYFMGESKGNGYYEICRK